MAFTVHSTPWPTGSSNPSPAYSGTFIPQIWSGKMIEKFYDATVLGAIANTDYEGEIRNQGDLVKIRTKPTITINNYEANMPLAFQRPSSSVVELQIDKGKYFNTILDDVMEIQADLDQLSMWADDASEQMKIVIDTDVLAALDAGTSADNKGTTAGRISNNLNLGTSGSPLSVVARNAGASEIDVMDLIVYMGQVLDEQNIPEQGRWLLIPAWFAALIKRSELRDASLTGDGASVMRNGRLGMIDRFTLFSTNLLPVTGGATNIIAGHKHGLTFASQLTKVETLRGESTFGTIMRGLQVYGYKVLDGIAIASSFAVKA